MLLHQIKFSLINMADKPYSDKAYEAEQFQKALQEIIVDQKLPITSTRIDDVDITGSYDSTVESVNVEYEQEEETGKLIIRFSDGTNGVMAFDDSDIITAYVYNEKLIIDVATGMPKFGEA